MRLRHDDPALDALGAEVRRRRIEHVLGEAEFDPSPSDLGAQRIEGRVVVAQAHATNVAELQADSLPTMSVFQRRPRGGCRP